MFDQQDWYECKDTENKCNYNIGNAAARRAPAQDNCDGDSEQDVEEDRMPREVAYARIYMLIIV